jgi:hypothetical protein
MLWSTFLPNSRDEWKAVGLRVAIEFVPPVAAGLFWLWFHWAQVQGFAQGLELFTKGFIAIAFVWWNYLRIHHQQTQKHQQAGIAGTVSSLMADFGAVKTTMAVLDAKLGAVLPRIPEQEAVEISTLANSANNQITAIESTVGRLSIKDFERKLEALGLRKLNPTPIGTIWKSKK